MGVGFLGIILPLLPDLPFIFLGALIYGVSTGFEIISFNTVVAFGLISLLALVIDFISSSLGARAKKATIWGQAGAIFGVVIGFMLPGFVGIFIGPILGVILFEILFARRSLRDAYSAGRGTFFGLVLGSLLKVVLAILMIGWFLKLLV